MEKIIEKLKKKGFEEFKDDETMLWMIKKTTGEIYKKNREMHLEEETRGKTYKIKMPDPDKIPDETLIRLAKEWRESGYKEGVEYLKEYILLSDKEKKDRGFEYYGDLYYRYEPDEFPGGYEKET